jgi:hypothetical protein
MSIPPKKPIDPIMQQMLRSIGIPEEQWEAYLRAHAEALAPERGVERSVEFVRVSSLPRRLWETGADDLAVRLTQYLRAPGGTQSLRPIQAAALRDAHDQGGMFGPIRVGGGKTLISLLACTILGLKKPMLLIPAKLKDKTQREMHALRKHWLIPAYVYIVSYELLGREQSANLLIQWAPDGIISDESHKLKGTKSVVTKRVGRYLEANPTTKFVAMSGTITKRSIKDYAHVCGWSLKERSPAPRDYNTRMEWSLAIDEQRDEDNRLAPGALFDFCTDEERTEFSRERDIRVIRRAYRRRFTETPGVVATQEGALGTSLRIDPLIIKDPNITGWAHHMRTTWTRPDGVEMMDGIELWRHLREVACGFYYRWSPAPPKEWVLARKVWTAAVRTVLRHNQRGLDSEKMVKRAIDADHYPEHKRALAEWRAIEPSYDPEKNKEAVWLSDAAIDAAIAWAKEERGIIWTEHVAFGERLAAKSGLDFYWRQGKNARGRVIEDHPPGTPMIASIASNAEGRNLQAWSTNLITSMPTAGSMAEQLFGRTHRDGQEADEVSFAIGASIPEQLAAFDRARADAQYISDMTGQEQKLSYADITIPPAEERGGLWNP